MNSQQSKQSEWFTEEVQPHEPALRAYLQNRFPPPTDIDDLVQESYLQLLRAKAAGRIIGNAKAYLFITARNAAFAVFRKPRIFADKPLTDFAVLNVLEEGVDVAESVCTKQEIAVLLDAVDALPARCREIFILRKLRGMAQKEIAVCLGLSEQTVQVQIGRGAKKCAQFLRSRGISVKSCP